MCWDGIAGFLNCILCCRCCDLGDLTDPNYQQKHYQQQQQLYAHYYGGGLQQPNNAYHPQAGMNAQARLTPDNPGYYEQLVDYYRRRVHPGDLPAGLRDGPTPDGQPINKQGEEVAVADTMEGEEEADVGIEGAEVGTVEPVAGIEAEVGTAEVMAVMGTAVTVMEAIVTAVTVTAVTVTAVTVTAATVTAATVTAVIVTAVIVTAAITEGGLLHDGSE